jgi:exopolysaccharide production protein ExoQ
MPPRLALILTVGFIVFLFRRDFRQKPNVTRALWLPVIWVFIVCTRYVSLWLGLAGFHVGATSLEDGSPLDALVFLILIFAAMRVLSKRQFELAKFANENPWIIAFFLYCCLSIIWSDYPFVSFKRWFKMLGTPLMALIVLTEPDPEEALKRLFKRVAYIFIPFSILTIKYYPTIGRNASPWATASMTRGIAGNKNALGADCLIFGFFFFWQWLQVWHAKKSKLRRKELTLTGGFLLMTLWLLHMAQSSTALGCLIFSVIILLVLGLRVIDKRVVGTYAVIGIILLLFAEAMFGISKVFIEALGRNATLTGRTVVWRELLDFHTNPIFGTGFDIFWMGDRLAKIGELYWWSPNEAHNGYLETYLNLGLIGVFLLLGWILDTFRKCRRELIVNLEFGRFRMAYLIAAVLYNVTESGFRRLHPVWFVFYLISIDYPKRRPTEVEILPAEDSEREVSPAEEEPVYSAQRS